jgi:ankyrin repeat protein
LHLAAKWSGKEIITVLIDRGLNVNLKDIKGDTPLHIAVKYCQLGGLHKFETKIETLFDKGADPKSKNLDGQTPWALALSGIIDETCLAKLETFDVKYE